LLRSRFGRRLLLLFLVCSLLPMAALAVLSFGTVTRQLREGSLGRLEHTSRSLAGVIAERLHFLDGDMAQVNDVTPCPAIPDDREGPTCDGLNYALSALSFIADAGASSKLFGIPLKAPLLPPAQRQALAAGNAVITASRADSQQVIYIMRHITTARGVSGVLVGAIYPEYLWGTPDQNPLIPTMQLHIVDRTGLVLFRSIKGEVTIPERVARRLGTDSTGTFEWDVANESYLAAYSPIVTPEGIANPPWMLVLSEGRTAVVAPMAQFRRTFPWVALASLGAALLLTLGLLRRHLAPLHALQEGTQRLANSSSTNRWRSRAATSSRTWPSPSTRWPTGSRDSSRHSPRPPRRTRRCCPRWTRHASWPPCSTGCATSAPATSSRLRSSTLPPAARHDISARPGRSRGAPGLRGAVPPGRHEPPVAEPAGIYAAQRVATAVPGPARERDGPGVRILPLIYQGELLGAIALAAFRSTRPDDDDLRQAERVAGQVVLALANARMVDQIRSLAYFDSLTGPAEPGFLQAEAHRGTGAERPAAAEARGVLPRPRPFQPDQRHARPSLRRSPGAGGGAPGPCLLPEARGRGVGGAPGR
jgi:hypothetical protein